MSTVDETSIPKYDWDKLREDVLANRSIEKQTITVDMRPTVEDKVRSSILSNTTNGIIPYLSTSNKIRQSGISGHHCTGKGCTLCKS